MTSRHGRPRRSMLPPLVLGGIALAIAWGLYASGLARRHPALPEGHPLPRQAASRARRHLRLAGHRLRRRHRHLAVAPVDGALGGRRDPGRQHGDVDPDARQARADDEPARHRRAAGDRRAVDRDAAADHPQHLRRHPRGAGASGRRGARDGHGAAARFSRASNCRTRSSSSSPACARRWRSTSARRRSHS